MVRETATIEKPPAKRRHRRADLAIGVALGLVLGLTILAAFVFLGSEGAVDAPHISGAENGQASRAAPSAPGSSRRSGDSATIGR